MYKEGEDLMDEKTFTGMANKYFGVQDEIIELLTEATKVDELVHELKIEGLLD